MSTRLSSEAKHKRGTARPDREPRQHSALHRLTVVPVAPERLSARARAEWNALAKVCVQLGVLTGGDLRSLELLAEVLASEAELRALLAVEGFVIPGAGNNSKAHPATRLLADTRSQAARMLADFGLNPRARLGVDIRPAETFNRFAVHGQGRAEAYFETKPWDKK
jgi:P27 family predicted phage terminase small subunit